MGAQTKERDETKLSKAQRTRMRKRLAKERKNASSSAAKPKPRQENAKQTGPTKPPMRQNKTDTAPVARPTKPPMRQNRIVPRPVRSIQSGYNSPVSSSTKLSKAQLRRLRKRITKERKREA